MEAGYTPDCPAATLHATTRKADSYPRRFKATPRVANSTASKQHETKSKDGKASAL